MTEKNKAKKIGTVLSVLIVLIGVFLVMAGCIGIGYTYKNVAQEKIITPGDASKPNIPVKGPLTLKVQADTIRKHVLKITGGKTFAEMPREVPKTDEKGNVILDDSGQPIMVNNSARDIWITATTLTTALNLAILAYSVSGLAVLTGVSLISTGVVFYLTLRQKI